MEIPSNLAERELFYQEVISKCTHTQEDRKTDYGTLRHFYLFGRGPDEDETPYNKVFPHIDTLTSFLFASETTKFSVHVPRSAPEIEYLRIPALAAAVNEDWLNSNTDHVVSQAITWALVYNTMLIKTIIRSERGFEISPFPVDPSCFGVLREDVPFGDRQEAMVHTFYTTKSQLAIDLAHHPQKNDILAKVEAMNISSPEDKPSGMDRVLMAATTPNITGNVVVPFGAQITYLPKVAEDLITMQELWVWDDKEGDYRVVTRAENGVTIFDRKNFFLPGEHPFTQFCPNPLYSYFWGISEVEGLVGLQRWRNERVLQMKSLLDLQVDPPTALTGWSGLIDEKAFALREAGGVLTTDDMNAKAQKFAPDMPPDIFAVIHEIDSMFAEKSGLQNIMMGKGEGGVRSGRQTTELARLGSARIKKRALVIEDSLERLATLYLKAKRKYDKTDYLDTKGNPFTAEQFTPEFTVKVDAHSNSPLFVEDQKQLAGEMLEAHAIDRARFIEMISPPSKELILRELKQIETKETEAAQQKAAQESNNQLQGGKR